eukprot:6475199-Amphidinium_carterae.1
MGIANPSLMRQDDEDACGCCHGDDFLVLGSAEVLEQVDTALKRKYEVKLSGKIGFGPKDDHEMEFLHRVLRCCTKTLSVEIESDQRHVSKLWQELGMDPKSTKSRDTPAIKQTAVEAEKAMQSPLLVGKWVTQYRSIVMRIAYLSLDRADLQ